MAGQACNASTLKFKGKVTTDNSSFYYRPARCHIFVYATVLDYVRCSAEDEKGDSFGIFRISPNGGRLHLIHVPHSRDDE